MNARNLLFAALLVCLGAATASADVIRLSSGGVVRGEIVSETARQVVVKTAIGTTTVPRDDIELIERGESAEQQYAKRLKTIDDADPEAHYTLGLWLKSLHAPHLARKEFKRTIELAPDHRFAREELNYVRHEGQWVKRSSLDASVREGETGTQGSTRRKRSRLELPASPALVEALRDIRSKDPVERRKAWEILCQDDAAEVERELELLEEGAEEAKRLLAQLRQATPDAETLLAEGGAAALRPQVEAYVREALRPAVDAALDSYGRWATRGHARFAKRVRGVLKEYRLDDAGGLEKRSKALQRWATARDAALKVIFDLNIYPDANHGRSGQPTVDEHVDAVRPVWAAFDAYVTRDLARLLAMDPAEALELLNIVVRQRDRLVELNACLTSRNLPAGDVPELEPAYQVLVAYRAGDVQGALARHNELSPYAQQLLRRLRDERCRTYNQGFKQTNPCAYGIKPSGNEVEQVRITNDYRVMMGRVRVEIDPRLVDSARDHSADMTRLGFFAHESPVAGKRSPFDRMARAGYSGAGGENISLGSITPKATHIAWYNSSGHHRNILGAEWWAMGSGQDDRHWTQNFGGVGSLAR